MTVSPQLRALGTEIRLLAILIDAVAAYGWYCDAVQARLDTALLTEKRGEGWNEDHAGRRLREWGVVDQHGVYLLAGLTKAEQEVAFLHYDRQLDSQEIGKLLVRPATTVRVQLHRAQERLRRLAA
jgi:hypothetical protein